MVGQFWLRTVDQHLSIRGLPTCKKLAVQAGSPHYGVFDLEIVNESIYDHPKYYDLVFGNDVAAERKFIEAAAERYVRKDSPKLFEPACGTGRLMYALARRGFSIEGIDLNGRAIEFCNQRFSKHGLSETAYVADMADFKAKVKFDLAFNTINSFRHLDTAKTANDHLRCMAASSKKDAVYLIGMHLSPTEGPTCDEESWSASRGHLTVLTQMWTADRNRQERLERFGVHFDVYTPTKQFRIVDELKMRSYTAAQFRAMVTRQGDWQIEEAFDFSYDINRPISVGPTTEDVVLVLRRRS